MKTIIGSRTLAVTGIPNTEPAPSSSLYHTHQSKRRRKANAHAESVKHRRQHAVFGSEHFGSCQNNAVDNDKRQINAEGAVYRRRERLDKHLYNRNKCRYYCYKGRNSYLVRYNVSEQRYDRI